MPVELTPLQSDALREMMNIASGQAANALAQLLHARAQMSVIQLLILQQATIRTFVAQNVQSNGSLIKMPFEGTIRGAAALMIPNHEVSTLLHMVQHHPDTPPNLRASPHDLLQEFGNIILNASIGTLSNILQTRISYRLPTVWLELDRAALLDRLLPTLPQVNGLGILLVNSLEVLRAQIRLLVFVLLIMPGQEVQKAVERLLHA